MLGQRPIQLMVVGVAANLGLSLALRAGYGARAASVQPIVLGTARAGEALVLRQEILIIGVALVLTRTGSAIRDVAQELRGAILIVIRPDRVLGFTVAVAAVTAGLAGALTAPVRDR